MEYLLCAMYCFSWSFIPFGSNGLIVNFIFTVYQSKRGFNSFPVLNSDSGTEVLMRLQYGQSHNWACINGNFTCYWYVDMGNVWFLSPTI